jgi:DNA-binding NtrC family response regulator
MEQKATPVGDTLRLLQQYPYPGNIRELKYIVELAALKAVEGHIYPEHLPDNVRFQRNEQQTHLQETREDAHASDSESETQGLRRDSDRVVMGQYTESVLQALDACRGSRRAAARELGISERKMYRLLKRFEEMGLDIPRPYQ